MLRILHKETVVATRLSLSLLEALQVRVEADMARKRLRQVKADFTLLSIQPDGKLQD